jgi:hypothetical protein
MSTLSSGIRSFVGLENVEGFTFTHREKLAMREMVEFHITNAVVYTTDIGWVAYCPFDAMTAVDVTAVDTSKTYLACLQCGLTTRTRGRDIFYCCNKDFDIASHKAVDLVEAIIVFFCTKIKNRFRTLHG